jgi:hypothetical protein
MFATGAFGRAIGSKRIKMILEKYPNIVEDYSINKQRYWIGKISEIPMFKDTTASAFVEGIPAYLKFIEKMPNLKISKPKKVKVKGTRLQNEYVIFTGVRSKELEEYVKEQGGEVGSAKGKMTILITKDIGSSSSKMQYARDKGAKIMTVEMFRKKYM